MSAIWESLHSLIRKKGTLEAIQEFKNVQKWPQSVKGADKNLILPLHQAIISKCSPDVVFCLLDLYPEAIEYSDNNFVNVLML